MTNRIKKHRLRTCKAVLFVLLVLFAVFHIQRPDALAQKQFDSGSATGSMDQDASGNIIFDINSAEKCRITTAGRITCQGGIQVGDTTIETTCGASDAGVIRYNSVGGGGGSPAIEYCDGTEWKTLGTGPAGAPPDCTDDATVECLLEATRSNDDPDFIASNISNGVNILGVTGTLVGAGACLIDAFSFADPGLVMKSTLVTSDIIEVTTAGCSLNVAISGGGSPEYRICNNASCSVVDHAWTNTSNNVDNGQYIQIRQTSSSSDSTTNTATLTVGGLITERDVTTYPPPKITFIKNTNINANMGGISGADALCQADATAAGVSGTFKAWVAIDAANDPESTFTQHTGPYLMVNGEKVADNWTDLTDGTLDTGIDIKADGTLYGTVGACLWTNVNSDGTFADASNTCTNWTSTSNFGRTGDTGRTNSSWSLNGSWTGCVSTCRILCFEQ